MQFKKIFLTLGLIAAAAKAVPIPPVEPTVIPAVDVPEVEISENVQGYVDYILSNISYTIKTVLEQELGSEVNAPATIDAVNGVVVDVLSKTNEDITTVVVSALGEDVDEASAAADAANKVAEILNAKVAEAVAANVSDIDSATVSEKIVADVADVVKDYIQKNFDTSKVVADTDDVPSMVLNGANYLIRTNLCKTADDAATCEALANTVMDAITDPLKEIVNENIVTENNAMTVGCSAIPSAMFEKLGNVVTDAITAQIEAENAPKTTYPVLALVANVVEHILCVDRPDAVNQEGKIIINDITDIATHIVNKVNQINNEVSFALDNKIDDKIGMTSSMAIIKQALN